MSGFGWDLPPGCGMLPCEEMLPQCCEECEDEGNDPNCMLTCEKYKKITNESEAADRQMHEDYVETEKIAKDAGYASQLHEVN